MTSYLQAFVATLLLFVVVRAQSSSDCSASVSLESSQPGHASFMYHDIMVQSTGSCGIHKVFVDITLPPYAVAFAYYNISNATGTGELLGLTDPLTYGSIEVGGTIVLNSARIPLVSLASVECDASCGSATRQTPAPTTTIKIETEWGSNAYWFAIALLDEDGLTSQVRITDSAGVNSEIMKREQWSTKRTFTYTPYKERLSLPISLVLISDDGDKIVLKNAVTSFNYNILDTRVSYSSSKTYNTSTEAIELFVHPASTSQHVAITPYGTKAANVTNIYLRAQNTDWILMEYTSVGYYEVSSPPEADFQLPIAVKVVVDGEDMTFEDAVHFTTD